MTYTGKNITTYLSSVKVMGTRVGNIRGPV